MEDWSSYTDQELIDAVRKGRPEAFAGLVGRHRRSVARTVKGMLGEVPEADDVGQEVFIRFYRSLNEFRGESKVSTYLTRIAINLSLNEIKKNKRKGTLISKDREDEGLPDIADHRDQGGQGDMKELLDKAIAGLDSGFRQVVVLRLIQGYSVRETAQILKVAEGTVLSRLARAQKKLKEMLNPYM